MVKVCFITGQEDSIDVPADTPEAFWRVYLPGKALGEAVILGHRKAIDRALKADVVWIYEPTCSAAASLADVARQMGKKVIIDFSEDPWRRAEADRAYMSIRMDGLERALDKADTLVAATPSLIPIFEEYGPTYLAETVIPLGPEWKPVPPKNPPLLGWWSDGRQKFGFELVADDIREVLTRRPDTKMAHVQFSHHAPLVRGMKTEEDRLSRAHQLSAHFEDDQSLTAEANLRLFIQHFAGSVISIESYAPGEYRDSVSDLPLLRAAALGIPSITTRNCAIPGTISADPGSWADWILQIIDDQDYRQQMSESARAWAETRSSYSQYETVLQEVLK